MDHDNSIIMNTTENTENTENNNDKKKDKRERKPKIVLDTCYFKFSNENMNEIGVDEAGRGPMIGRVYSAAVILPKDPLLFDHGSMKDSKKFTSNKKIKEVANYIKEHAIAWSVGYSTEQVIDDINIRNATHRAMHEAIRGTMKMVNANANANANVEDLPHLYHLLIDGNDFTPFTSVNKQTLEFIQVPHTCIESGDNKYSSIAAASILAKVSRDTYIEELCKENPYLDEKYGVLKNKGYGTKKHMDGIKEYGITKFHRKSFGICKQFSA